MKKVYIPTIDHESLRPTSRLMQDKRRQRLDEAGK